MKRALMILMVVALLAVVPRAFAIEVNLVGVVQNGQIRSNVNYYANGVANPYFEIQYISTTVLKGTAGIASQGLLSGAFATKEQLEVQGGYGWFETRAGASTLLNVTDEDTGVVSGTLSQPAIGFKGALSSGTVLTGFDSTGFKGSAEANMNGSLTAGAMKIVTVGSSETPPSTSEYYKGLWSFGPGPIQVKVEISFPK